MCCRQPNLPIDIEMQSESVEELIKHYDEIVEPDHGEKFKEHISTLQEVAKNIKVAQIKYKKQYDKKHAKPSEFYIGQLVLKKDFTRKKTKGGKLSFRYVGPFTITRVKSRGVYELCSDDGKVTSATGGHLKVYRKPLGSDADHSSNPTHTSEDDGSLSNDGSISEDYRSTADDHFPLYGNRDHNDKPLDIALDQAPSIRDRIKGDGNCFFRAVAQEITGRQEDHAASWSMIGSHLVGTTAIDHTPFWTKLPVDLMYGSNRIEERCATEYAQNLREGLQSAYALVREHCKAEHRRQKDIYDEKVHGKPFVPGELPRSRQAASRDDNSQSATTVQQPVGQPTIADELLDDNDEQPTGNDVQDEDGPAPVPDPRRYPTRDRRIPERYGPYLQH
ncbi:hypothetical protein EMCRGX_G022879 [Ephydatia muelleri]